MMGSGDLGFGVTIVLIDEFSDGARRVRQGFVGLEDGMAKLGAKTFVLNQLGQGLSTLEGMLQKVIAPGAAFDQQLMELSAITGLAGAGLDDIGQRALTLSKRFGSDAASGVGAFQGFLNKLGPEIATNADALEAMGSNAFTLSKLMKNDLTGAGEALTTSMNLYAGSITDPLEMTKQMTKQMNIMAAGARVGSADVSDVAASIRTGGLAAKSASVTFQELNAMIQLMGKGAVYGSEAGVAIRNVLGIMGQGEYLPKKAVEGLKKAGVNLALIGDQSRPIAERLREIAKIQNNSALVTEVFGRENSNAFRVLAQNLNLMPEWTASMNEQNSATVQANIVMQSFSEKMNRVKARIEGYAISIFQATKGALPFVMTTLQLTQGALSLAPAYVAATEGLAAFRASAFMTSVSNIGLGATFEGLAVAAWTAMVPLLPYIAIGAAIAGVIWLAWKAVSSFQQLLKDGKVEGGFWGVLQKIGGVVMGVIEAFQTWDGVTFSLSENMRANLEKIGVLDLVLRLATWVVRLKEFFQGLGAGISEAFGEMKQWFGAVWGYIGPLIAEFSEWQTTIKKLIGDTLNWRDAGRALAWTLGLIAKVVGAVLVAGFILLGLAIAGVVKIVSFAISVVGYFFTGLTELAKIIIAIPGYVMSLWPMMQAQMAAGLDWLMTLPGALVDFGASIVSAIGRGILGAWAGLKSMLVNLMHELPMGDRIMEFLGISSGGGRMSVADAGPGNSGAASIGRTMATTKGITATPFAPAPGAGSSGTVHTGDIIIPLMLDGEEVSRSTMKREQLNDLRG